MPVCVENCIEFPPPKNPIMQCEKKSLKRTTNYIDLKTERWFTSAISRPANRAFLLWRITHSTVPITTSKLAVVTATNAPIPAESVAGLELSSIVWWSKNNKRIYLLVEVVVEKPSRFCWFCSRLGLGLIEAVLTRRRGKLDWQVVMISEHKETLTMTNCE